MRRSSVYLTHHLGRDAASLLSQLAGLAERLLDAGDDLVEVVAAKERIGLRKLLVVSAGDVERGVRRSLGRSLVEEDADRRAVVDEAVEKDRARVRDDASTC